MTNQRGVSVASGTDALTIDLSPAGVAERRRRQAITRKLAAQNACHAYGVDPDTARPSDLNAGVAARDFRELCEVLGLDEPSGGA